MVVRSARFVNRMRLLSICSFPAPLYVIFGDCFISLIMLHLPLVLPICLALGCRVLIRKVKLLFALASVLLFGLFGTAVMMLSLTRFKMFTFYRLFTELLTGSTCGPGFYRPTNGCIWILDVPGLWQLFGLSSTVMGGISLEGLLSFSSSSLHFGYAVAGL